jgi:membrane protein
VTGITSRTASAINVPPGYTKSSTGATTMAKEQLGILGLVKKSFSDFMEDDCMDSAAALSYYTIFSLPAILVLLMLVISTVLDPQDVQGGLESQIQSLMGPTAGGEVRTILQEAERPQGGTLPTILGIAGLLFGATGVMGQLQKTLNRTWGVKPDPNQGGIKNFITKRFFSLGMLLAFAFLLMVSLVLSAVLTGLGDRIGNVLPSALSGPMLEVFNLVISLAAFVLLFAALFKVMPDAKIAWRSVWVGAAATALLFLIGKFLIGFYLGKSNPGEAYGAAGSMAVLLLWIYYSSLIVLFGAEFTETWAVHRGEGIEPEPGAVRVDREPQRVGSSAPRPA